MTDVREDAPTLGEITIATTAIAQIAGRTAAECYGVVGTAARGGRLGRLVSRDRPERGVEIVRTPDGLVVTLRVVPSASRVVTLYTHKSAPIAE